MTSVMTWILYNTTFNCSTITWRITIYKWNNIGFSSMVLRGNSKIHVSSNGCVFSTRGTRCHIFGTILRLDMEKGNMMEQVHASRLHYIGNRWNSQLFCSSKMQRPLLHGVLQWWGRELEGKKTNHLKKHMYIDIFGRWLMYIDHTYMSARPSKEIMHSI